MNEASFLPASFAIASATASPMLFAGADAADDSDVAVVATAVVAPMERSRSSLSEGGRDVVRASAARSRREDRYDEAAPTRVDGDDDDDEDRATTVGSDLLPSRLGTIDDGDNDDDDEGEDEDDRLFHIVMAISEDEAPRRDAREFAAAAAWAAREDIFLSLSPK